MREIVLELPEAWLERLEAKAEAEHMSREDFVRIALGERWPELRAAEMESDSVEENRRTTCTEHGQ